MDNWSSTSGIVGLISVALVWLLTREEYNLQYFVGMIYRRIILRIIACGYEYMTTIYMNTLTRLVVDQTNTVDFILTCGVTKCFLAVFFINCAQFNLYFVLKHASILNFIFMDFIVSIV